MLKHIAQTTRIGNLLEMKYFGSELAKDTMKYLSINNNNNMHALFLLSGEAGVGKTTFTQGFINECISANNQSENQSIRMEENQKHHHIPSPTFCLINEYWCKTLKIPINHMDLYRLEHSTKDVLETIEIPIIFNNAITLVEWPDRLFHAGIEVPKPYINLHIEYDNDDENKCNNVKDTNRNKEEHEKEKYNFDFDTYHNQTRIIHICEEK